MLSPLGLPLFVLLLLRSKLHYKWRKQVAWKNRTYPTTMEVRNINADEATVRTKGVELRAKS